MAANENDFFQKKGAGTVTTLSSPGKALGATSITVGSTANYPTETGITIGIRQVDTAGDLISGTYTEWTGVVASGTSITINATPVYGSDQVYPAGSTTQVYIPLSETSHNRLVDGILTHANQDGLLLGTPESFVGTAGDIGGAWKTFNTNPQGFSALTTSACFYTVIGKTCIAHIDITGTSNANSFTLTLPFTSRRWVNEVARVRDNVETISYGLAEVKDNSATLTIYPLPSGGSWTTSGTKRLFYFTISFEIA